MEDESDYSQALLDDIYYDTAHIIIDKNANSLAEEYAQKYHGLRK